MKLTNVYLLTLVMFFALNIPSEAQQPTKGLPRVGVIFSFGTQRMHLHRFTKPTSKACGIWVISRERISFLNVATRKADWIGWHRLYKSSCNRKSM